MLTSQGFPEPAPDLVLILSFAGVVTQSCDTIPAQCTLTGSHRQGQPGSSRSVPPSEEEFLMKE